MITKRDMGLIHDPVYINIVAKEMGTGSIGKSFRTLDQGAASGSLIFLFKKGNPLLYRFSFLMRRYLGAGFPDRLMTNMQHRASLTGGGRFGEAAGDMFFAFSVSHLMPAFLVLLVGTVLSSVVFIVELIVNCLCKRREKK
jgi:hypothetical protein